jgi:hypothetical protein
MQSPPPPCPSLPNQSRLCRFASTRLLTSRPCPIQIVRLLLVVFFAAHFYACIFWAVAATYRTPDEIDALLVDKHAPADVSDCLGL